ncbi:hypothetical protein F2Q69_00055909 [Brassica cretica]|uniref:Uncharacterized protein n=1 Tax=Brassica cretica TaxID=69181 RepID=A0A8S9MWS1_BRACR|nr:hypothetical protein F2Q69_00055909 [Brassica cretica]
MMIQNVPDTSSLDYWLNWRVFLCAVWVLTPMIVALFVIWKYEKDSSVETQRPKGSYSEHSEDIWRPSLEKIHPGWLLGFRVLAFCFLLTSNIVTCQARFSWFPHLLLLHSVNDCEFAYEQTSTILNRLVLLLHLVDRKFCYFPMASPCVYLRRVAISISRPFNSHGSSVVSVGSTPASSFLCPLCIIRQNQTPIHILN